MRVLCLHGRGSNNEIFHLQTASFRADLDDFEWEFVQGTVLHTEGNWSLYTTAFSKSPLYVYYNPLNPESVLQTEDDLLQIIEENGPFDGVLGYSGGASLAAQIIIRDIRENPMKLPHERPFRFAVFINGASPLHVFRMADVDVMDEEVDVSKEIKEVEGMFLRPSALRKKDGVVETDQPGGDAMFQALARLKGRKLADGTPFLTDDITFGMTRYNSHLEEVLIDIPTLHVRSPVEDDVHHGVHLLNMCDPSTAREYHHKYGHDFPRGREEMKKIAQLIRETAEGA